MAETDLDRTMAQYGNTLFRICLVILRNTQDAEDAVQETFIKYLQKKPVFESSEHEKAWFITVVTNKARDICRFYFRHPKVDLEDWKEYGAREEDSSILEALMELPEKYRVVLTLHYVEELKVKDIAQALGMKESAVKMRLQKGRTLLEETYRKTNY